MPEQQDKIATFDMLAKTVSPLENSYFNSIKKSEEEAQQKQRTIYEKYDIIFKNINMEHKNNLSLARTLTNEHKRKTGSYITENEHEVEYVALSQVEEQFQTYENKLKNIYLELQTKEKYVSVVDHKYDMINEENKFIKKKVKEEKEVLMKEIEQIQKEVRLNYEREVYNLKQEIEDMKQKFEDKFEVNLKNLETSETSIRSVIREKDMLKEKINTQKGYLDTSNQENKDLRDEIHQKNKMLQQLREKGNEKVAEQEYIEKLKAKIDELKNNMKEDKIKIIKLEMNEAALQEKLDNKNAETRKLLNEYEKNKQTIIDKLKDNQSDIQRKHRDSLATFDNEKLKYVSLLKIKEDDIESNY